MGSNCLPSDLGSDKSRFAEAAGRTLNREQLPRIGIVVCRLFLLGRFRYSTKTCRIGGMDNREQNVNSRYNTETGNLTEILRMNVSLGPDDEKLVEEKLASGQFPSPEAVVSEAFQASGTARN